MTGQQGLAAKKKAEVRRSRPDLFASDIPQMDAHSLSRSWYRYLASDGCDMDAKYAIADAAQEIMDQLDATLRALLATSIPNETKLAVGQHISYATLSLEGFIEHLHDPLDHEPD